MFEIRGLSLTQPWASLIVKRLKKIETRGWPSNYRGWLLIHAAKSFPADARDFYHARRVQELMGNPITEKAQEKPFLGAIVGVARLVDCLPSEAFEYQPHALKPKEGAETPYKVQLSEEEFMFGNYDPNRYGLILEDAVEMPPYPYKGALGLWKADPAVEQIYREFIDSRLKA